MTANKYRWAIDARIILAIAAKDIVDAIRNKTTLAVFVTSLFMVAMYRAMPYLEGRNEPPAIFVHDAGNSPIVRSLEESDRIRLYTPSSRDSMLAGIREGDKPELGLELPSDFDQALGDQSEVGIQGYVVSWVKEADAAELKALMEDELGELAGEPVSINIVGNRVYPDKSSTGRPFLDAFGMMYVVTMTGLFMVPHLMFEEKKTRTMDALLVSPASTWHIVAGKALTGLFYCLLGASIAFAVNADLVTHWGLATLLALCGSLFSVSLGLLLGITLENRQQLTLAAWVIIVPLLIPAFLSIMDDIMPKLVLDISDWIPTAALVKALRVSFAERAPLADFAREMGLILAYSGLALGAAAMILRRSDRRP